MLGRTLTAITLVFLSLTQAEAFPFIIDNPAAIARTHCRLMLRTSEPPQGPLLGYTVEELVGERYLATRLTPEMEKAAYIQSGGLPDWGFIIGKRWEVATREERKNFNFYFTKYLLKTHGITLAGEDISRACQMEVRYESYEGEPLTTTPGDKPYIAKVSTRVSHIGMEHSVPLTYRLEKTPDTRWDLSDIEIYDASLVQTHRTALNEKIAEGGYQKINIFLIQVLSN